MGAPEQRLIIIKTGSTLPSLKAARGDFEDWILAGMGAKIAGTGSPG